MKAISQTFALTQGWTQNLAARLQGRKALHFLHIGKTGGTAIKHALKDDRLTGAYRVVLHDHAFRLAMVGEDAAAFFFLRDPAARFVSGFSSRRRKGQPRYYHEWSRQEAAAFARFRSADELARALCAPDEEMRAAAADAMGSIQHVKDSYAVLFGGLQGLQAQDRKIAFVGFHEQMEEAFRALKACFGLPVRLDLPRDSFHAHRSAGAPALSRQAAENLRHWYAEDYRIYEHLKQRWWLHAGQAG